VIEAYVDANGRIQDYQILSDPNDSKALWSQVKQMLIFTAFRTGHVDGEADFGAGCAVFLEDQRSGLTSGAKIGVSIALAARCRMPSRLFAYPFPAFQQRFNLYPSSSFQPLR
jgi:hypothetical protein